ncbi:MAG: hypothetical protein JNM69_29370 [Archangium sp.]|nr:hypothetical protein [Archangium sp.]
MTDSTVRRVVFFSALYDLLVTWPFATPWTASWLSGQLGSLHLQLGLGGVGPSLDSSTALLFANLMGSIVTVWSILRLLRPTAELGAADTAGRALFSTWMLFALLHGASATLLPFLVLEVAWGLVQGAVVLPRVWRPVQQA